MGGMGGMGGMSFAQVDADNEADIEEGDVNTRDLYLS